MNFTGYSEKFRSAIYNEVINEDVYSLKSIHDPLDLIVDIGANLGYFSYFARQLFSNAKIIALEPTPETYGYLQQNIAKFNIETIQKGIGDGSLMELFIAKNPGSNKLLKKIDGNIETITLKQLVSKYPVNYLIKFDCQEGEYSFLHPDNLEVICNALYLCGEFHFPESHQEFMNIFMKKISHFNFTITHQNSSTFNFFARRKKCLYV